jgi:hypothetical protein
MMFIETSAKDAVNVEKAFRSLSNKIKEKVIRKNKNGDNDIIKKDKLKSKLHYHKTCC